MSGEALKIIKAVYGAGNTEYGAGKTSSAKGHTGVAQGGQSKGETPTFGIQGRAPLTQDMFEYKGQTLSKSEVRKKSYDDVYRHEAAHLSAAGKYAASGIIIDYDGNGFATSGHVNINMPTINPDDLDGTIDHATAVIASAEAPASFDELSDADKNVAAKARAIKAEALAMRGNQAKGSGKHKPLNFLA